MNGIWQAILGGTFAPVSAIILCIVASSGVVWIASTRGSDSTAAPSEQEDEH